MVSQSSKFRAKGNEQPKDKYLHIFTQQDGTGTKRETGTVRTLCPGAESMRNRPNRKLEPLEPFHTRTVTGPNPGHPDTKGHPVGNACVMCSLMDM